MKILLSILSSTGIIATASIPIINKSDEYLSLNSVEQDINSEISVEKVGDSGIGFNSDFRSLQNLKELDPTITYDHLLKNEISLQINGEINLATTLNQKTVNSYNLNIEKTSETITATFQDSLETLTPNVNQWAKAKIQIIIDKDLNVKLSNQVRVNSLIGTGKAESTSTIKSMKLIY